MKYVLLIPGWYPSRVNFLTGDFIERHARAAALYFPVKVLFVVKDNSLSFGKIVLEREMAGDYEMFIYYYSSGTGSRLTEKAVSVWLQARCLYKGFRMIVHNYGLPSLVHAHVLVKHAWFALRKARQYHLPLIASEQWTGYLPEAASEFQTLSSFQKKSISQVLRYASHVTTVSGYLAQQLKKRFYFSSHSVIPNLVDTSIFQATSQDRNTSTTFIHISTLSPQKNFDEILEACRLLKASGEVFKLLVFAPSHPSYESRIDDTGLSGIVEFRKEVPQSELSREMAMADALILYSNYETFGCVIVEANACGIPVIVSDIPVFGENVQEGITGFKVPLHDPAALAGCMKKIIHKQHAFDKAAIRSITKEKYSFEVIGKQFADLYARYAKP